MLRYNGHAPSWSSESVTTTQTALLDSTHPPSYWFHPSTILVLARPFCKPNCHLFIVLGPCHINCDHHHLPTTQQYQVIVITITTTSKHHPNTTLPRSANHTTGQPNTRPHLQRSPWPANHTTPTPHQHQTTITARSPWPANHAFLFYSPMNTLNAFPSRGWYIFLTPFLVTLASWVDCSRT